MKLSRRRRSRFLTGFDRTAWHLYASFGVERLGEYEQMTIASQIDQRFIYPPEQRNRPFR